jgi:tetratricopeptide (TPR) repeat protein
LWIWPFTIFLVAILLTLNFISKNSGFDGMPFYFGVEALTRTFAVLGWFARLAVSPESRHYFYPVLEVSYLPLMVAGGMAVLAATIYGLKILISKRSIEGFALVTFLLLCLPYMQLVPNHPPSLVSDRYIALAIWPSTLLIVALCWRLKPIPRAAILASLAILWTIQTFERPNDWRSPEAMVEADASANPDHYLPALLKISGIQLPTRKYREALNTASNITNPEFRDVLTSLVKSDYEVKFGTIPKGNPDEAISLLLKTEQLLKKPPEQIKWNAPARYTWDAFKDDMLIGEWDALAAQYPNDMLVQYYTGLWNVEIHQYLFAVPHLRAATESQQLPIAIRGSAYKSLGMALLNSGYTARAEIPLKAALDQLPPDQEAYCLLSFLYKQTNRIDEAKQSDDECQKYEQIGNAIQ